MRAYLAPTLLQFLNIVLAAPSSLHATCPISGAQLFMRDAVTLLHLRENVSAAGVSKEVACNVVKRVSESNLRNVRNLDGFARSILRRIEDEGIDVGRADLSSLDRDVADAIHRHVDDRAVDNSDFSTVQVVNALKEMPVRDAIEVCG